MVNRNSTASFSGRGGRKVIPSLIIRKKAHAHENTTEQNVRAKAFTSVKAFSVIKNLK